MSYRLLLVDDEVHAIEGIKADLDLLKLRISQLYIAYDSIQAKEILKSKPVDIMLCDIEMPQGSGLELLKWVRDNSYNTVTIFLTSHAEFEYAKEAMRLGSLEYLLKPILPDELESVMHKAQQIIDRNSELNRISLSHQLWMKYHSLIVERFWVDLITQNIASRWSAISEQIDQRQLPITETMRFLPVYISIHKWNKTLTRRDEKILEYGIKNVAEEIILSDDQNGHFFFLERCEMLGMIATDESTLSHKLIASMKQFVEFSQQSFYCQLSCYIGEATSIANIAGMVATLRQKAHNDVAFYNKVVLWHDNINQQSQAALPDINLWLTLIKPKSKQALIQEIEHYIDELVKNKEMNVKVLHQFHHDFMQALYSYLNREGIQAHKLFGDELSIQLSDNASKTVDDLLLWVNHAVNVAFHHAFTVQKSDNVIAIVKRHIAGHLDQELSRESLAELVFLHPDYFSRMFKKKTGVSITDYIMNERIQLARKMLIETDATISQIAIMVGYNNFSHFTKVFKKIVGFGPSEYRQEKSKES